MDSQNQKGMDIIAKEESKKFLQRLEDYYPWIHWKEPIKLSNLEGMERFGCRICIAKYGIRGEQIRYLPITLEGHQQHMREKHGITEFKI